MRFLARTITSPTLRESVEAFLGTFGDAKLVEYDPLSVSALLDAQEEAYGVRAVPRYHFERAEVVISFDADFLGTWISPVEFTSTYLERRKLSSDAPTMSYHAQIESRLSITGSNAAERWTLRPSEVSSGLAQLAAAVAKRAGVKAPWSSLPKGPIEAGVVEKLAERLWTGPRGRTLVVCGANESDAQRITTWINHVLQNDSDQVEATIDLHRPSYQMRGNDRDLMALLAEIRDEKVGALFVHDVNPAYDLPDGVNLGKAIGKIPVVISFAERVDETAEHAKYVCPDHHYLESWRDAEPVAGVVTIAQPAIRPLGETRSAAESLAAWSGAARSHHDILRDYWSRELLPRSAPGEGTKTLDRLWDDALQRGFVELAPLSKVPFSYRPPALAVPAARSASGLEIALYAKVGLRDGREAHNAWLQELPDPISKATWDNYAAIAPSLAEELGVKDGDVVRLAGSAAGGSKVTLDLPALVQPGQDSSTIAVALGYGRKGTDRFLNVGPQWIEARPTVEEGQTVGVNAAPLLSIAGGTLRFGGAKVEVSRTGEERPIARTQQYHSLEVPRHLAPGKGHPRPIVQETTFATYQKDPEAGSHHAHALDTMWTEDHSYDGHHWAMAIDLTRCTGCSACVVGCQAENNVPVVGKDEISRNREMSWLRIDRYYSGEGDEVSVAHQPMMCQHCDNAPCENVCPVLATLHSEEGLNQQVYNRCVGTRYCANNCPYKTRRFNWFDYPHNDKLENMVLNPDVTVRSRGIMEKCSFCVQRIQEAKFEAKSEGRELRDGDVQPACVQSCPAQAIVFGDRNQRESEITKQRGDPRHYHVLEELNVLPSVGYLRKVRNREGGEQHHG